MTKVRNVIYAGPADSGFSHAQVLEGPALSAATLPGTLMVESATGFTDSTAAATLAGQRALFADKNSLQARRIDEAWTQNDTMAVLLGRPGELFNVRVAAAQDITSAGVALTSNGDGTLKIAAVATDTIIAYSDEIINTAGAEALVRVRIA